MSRALNFSAILALRQLPFVMGVPLLLHFAWHLAWGWTVVLSALALMAVVWQIARLYREQRRQGSAG